MRKLFVFVFCLSLLVLLSSKKFSYKQEQQEPLFTVGKKYNGFVVTKSLAITELQSHLTELTHETSGATVLHIHAPDPENFFCISVRTPPTSSNGIAHVLEHLTCERSEKFPARDVFFSMMRRSLKTFMNAVTGGDSTKYLASSQVEEDFYNLFDVYLDCVFHPVLDPLGFAQEGHRLEFSIPHDPTSPLEYKGIVYNEMKGNQSSLLIRRVRALYAALFPNTPYGFNSGGNPEDIPSLTHEELVNFHRAHYYPGNCLFFLYGDIPLKKHLDFLEKQTLHNAKKKPPVPTVAKQPRFSKKVTQDLFYPAPEGTNSGDFVSFAWLTIPATNAREMLAMTILDTALIGSDASPLKQELLRSGLCKQVITFMDDMKTEAPYGILLEGCNAQDADSLELLIMNSFTRFAKEGISRDLINRAMHQLELHYSEIRQNQEPFGLTLLNRCAWIAQNGGNAEDMLCTQSLFNDMRETLQTNPTFFQDMISKYLINNPHFVRQCLKPSTELAKEEFHKEKEKLAEIKKNLSPQDIAHIITVSENLKKPEDPRLLDSLPKISLETVPKNGVKFELARQSVGNIDIFYHKTFTNHLIYADLSFPLPEIKDEDLWLVQLFSTLLPQVGCKTRSYAENLEYIQDHTGGIQSYLSINHQTQDANISLPSFHIKGKALDRNAETLFSLLFDIATESNFKEKSRLKEFITMHASDLQNTLAQNALDYAITVSSDSRIAHSWYGLEYLRKVQHLADHFDQEADKLINTLTELQKVLLCNQRAHLVITSDQETYNRSAASDFGGLVHLPIRSHSPWKNWFSMPKASPTAHLIGAPVAFNAMSFRTLSYAHPQSAAITIATYIFNNNVLLEKIRKQGGAYGGKSTYHPIAGRMTFLSYRDPHIAATVDAFEEAIQTVLSGNFTDSELEEAKLGILQALDAPVPPGNRGFYAHSNLRSNITDELYQIFRNNVFSATREDIQKATEEHIAPGFKESVLITFTGQELVEKENGKLKTPLHISKP